MRSSELYKCGVKNAKCVLKFQNERFLNPKCNERVYHYFQMTWLSCEAKRICPLIPKPYKGRLSTRTASDAGDHFAQNIRMFNECKINQTDTRDICQFHLSATVAEMWNLHDLTTTISICYEQWGQVDRVSSSTTTRFRVYIHVNDSGRLLRPSGALSSMLTCCTEVYDSFFMVKN